MALWRCSAKPSGEDTFAISFKNARPLLRYRGTTQCLGVSQCRTFTDDDNLRRVRKLAPVMRTPFRAIVQPVLFQTNLTKRVAGLLWNDWAPPEIIED